MPHHVSQTLNAATWALNTLYAVIQTLFQNNLKFLNLKKLSFLRRMHRLQNKEFAWLSPEARANPKLPPIIPISNQSFGTATSLNIFPFSFIAQAFIPRRDRDARLVENSPTLNADYQQYPVSNTTTLQQQRNQQLYCRQL